MSSKGQSEARAIKRGNIIFDSKQDMFINKKDGKKYFQQVLKRNNRLSAK